jgi:hypothetical protein
VSLYEAYGKVVAFFMYCAAFTFVPPLVDTTVAYLAHYIALKYVYIAIILSTITAVTLIYNLSLWLIYRAKLPFFEQYRVNPDVKVMLYRNPGLGSKIRANGTSSFGEA